MYLTGQKEILVEMVGKNYQRKNFKQMKTIVENNWDVD